MKIIPNIPVVFEGKFPDNYQNIIQNWGFFSQQEIEKNREYLSH